MSRPIGYRAKKPIPASELAAAETAVEPIVFNATDSARQLAAEHDINLADISGSGADGRITKSDVEAAIATQAAADGETDTGGDNEPEN